MRDNGAVTASDYKPVHAIDLLPPATKAAVIDGILAGGSLRDIGKIAGVSAATVMRYRDKVILPSLGVKRSKLNSPITVETPATGATLPAIPMSTQDITVQRASTKDVMRASPVKERLEKLYGRTDRLLDRAEGNDKLVGLSPGLLNQAHKNVEMLAKLTGELQDGRGGGGPAVAIQIVYHGAQAPEVAMNESGVIDAPGIKIGIRSQS